jgi:hypothetical protein
MTGPQGAYKRDGFRGVWRWSLGHGIKRWLKAKRWAQRKVKSVRRKNREGFRKAEEVYARKVRWYREHRDPKPPKDFEAVVTFDGKPCAHWIAKILKAARESGVWRGGLNSGYRSPEYSEQLCYQICGAPTCPGRCAGRSSSHSGSKFPNGAADVSDPEGLEAFCRSHNRPLRGLVLGPTDPWHFSRTGH